MNTRSLPVRMYFAQFPLAEELAHDTELHAALAHDTVRRVEAKGYRAIAEPSMDLVEVIPELVELEDSETGERFQGPSHVLYVKVQCVTDDPSAG